MNKDKALESVNEIKELMEKSSKFISVSYTHLFFGKNRIIGMIKLYRFAIAIQPSFSDSPASFYGNLSFRIGFNKNSTTIYLSLIHISMNWITVKSFMYLNN